MVDEWICCGSYTDHATYFFDHVICFEICDEIYFCDDRAIDCANDHENDFCCRICFCDELTRLLQPLQCE